MSARQRPYSHDPDIPIRAKFPYSSSSSSHQSTVDHKPALRRTLRGLPSLTKRIRRAMLLISVFGLLYVVYSWTTGSHAARLAWQQKEIQHLPNCPNYGEYAQRRHTPFSEGRLVLPFQRPIEECRTFRSEQVERLINEVTSKLVDKDLARLFENCFPNTLDTTVRWHQPDPKDPQSFIITGDINAEWLRDSTNQLAPYARLLGKEKRLDLLFRGAIATQAEFVTKSPYCNAFQPPVDSHIPAVSDHSQDKVHPIYDPTEVFECKYELDSLASFLKLSWIYFDKTRSFDFVTPSWLKAVALVLKVLEEQSEGTFDDVTGEVKIPKYLFQRSTTSGTETLSLSGAGNPVNGNTSLVRSAFRPSDDATILQFLVPANAFMSVELSHVADILHHLRSYASVSSETISFMAEKAETFSQSIAMGIAENAVFDHPVFGKVFAYEVDGYGGRIFMDDANLPSLLSLPLLGFLEASDPIYIATRKMVLSSLGNPYFLQGRQFKGIGGPHIGTKHAWPMSLIVQIMTSDQDDEITELLTMVKESTGGLGLMHESVNVKRVADYTRPWFAWANGLFGEMILDLMVRKPHLILEKEYKHSRD